MNWDRARRDKAGAISAGVVADQVEARTREAELDGLAMKDRARLLLDAIGDKQVRYLGQGDAKAITTLIRKNGEENRRHTAWCSKHGVQVLQFREQLRSSPEDTTSVPLRPTATAKQIQHLVSNEHEFQRKLRAVGKRMDVDPEILWARLEAE